MSAKLTTPGLLKSNVFLDKGYDFVTWFMTSSTKFCYVNETIYGQVTNETIYGQVTNMG